MIAKNLDKQSFFFNPLRSPLLWVFIGAHLLFAILLGDIHAFAPDESYYMKVVEDTYQSGFSTKDVLGWHHTQVWLMRIAYFPTYFFSVIGIPDYLAIRFESILLCTIAVYLLLCVFRTNPIARNRWLLILVLLIPSSFVWMTLGLRECFIFVSLASVCTGVVTFIRGEYRASLIFLTVGNLVLFETKQMLFLLSFGALLLTILFSAYKARGIKNFHFVILASIVIPLIVFPHGTRITVNTIKYQTGFFVSTGQAEIAEYAESIESAPSESGVSTSDYLRREILEQPQNIIVRILKMTGIDQKISPTPAVSSGENSSSGTAPLTPRSSKLDVIPASISDPLSIAMRTAAFLFTPFPLVDNGSFFVNLVALEAPLWWIFYIAVGVAIWRRFALRAIDELTVFVLGYSTAFLLFSALTEINLGTLTRHRSVLLIPLLFLILSTPRKSQPVE